MSEKYLVRVEIGVDWPLEDYQYGEVWVEEEFFNKNKEDLQYLEVYIDKEVGSYEVNCKKFTETEAIRMYNMQGGENILESDILCDMKNILELSKSEVEKIEKLNKQLEKLNNQL